MPHRAKLYLDRLDAVVFDMDGVVTDTARTHAAAWKTTFDEFLEQRAAESGVPAVPFDIEGDYVRYVDGRSRLDGARAFLESRGIDPDDATVEAIAEKKTARFLEEIERNGAAAYPSTVLIVRQLRDAGTRTAVVSASRNCARIVAAAGVDHLFDVRVDGNDLRRLGLLGKPDPALFQEAARRLGVRPSRAAVVEDALAGVEAGRRGGFAVVVGVDRRGDVEAEMYERGATVVVHDLVGVTVARGAA